MSKMAEMAQTIEELRTAAASINAAADWLYQQFSGGDEAQASEAPAKEEPKPELKLEDVRAVLAEKSRAGHTAGYAPCFRSTVPQSSRRLIRQTMKPCFRTRR